MKSILLKELYKLLPSYVIYQRAEGSILLRWTIYKNFALEDGEVAG